MILSFDISCKDSNAFNNLSFIILFNLKKYIKIIHCCRDDSSYSAIQEEISECFKFIKTFINNGDFVKHVRNDSPDMEDIEDKLDQNLLDLKRTDCSIVFAGEYFIYLIKNA